LVFGEGTPVKLVADMETDPEYKSYGTKTEPKVSIITNTASQGSRCLRFEHTGSGPRRAGIAFPVDGAEGFNTLAFDIFTAREDYYSRVNVRIQQEFEAKRKVGLFSAMLKTRGYVGGWTSVRLGKDAGFRFYPVGGARPDWGKVREVKFELHDGSETTTVLYIDNIRFEKVEEIDDTRNLLYNSSFEIATNPDVPDGWGRDLAVPPFGEGVWGIDRDTAFNGKNSLRIGRHGKFSRYWIKHLTAEADQPYTFSVYMKSAAEKSSAEIRLNGVKDAKKQVETGTEWKRYSIGGTAAGRRLFPQVTLVSGGPLWMDAAQLEAGTNATEYKAAALDSVKTDKRLSVPAVYGEWPGIPKVGKPKLELDGTEFDFYTHETEARSRCFVNVPEQECSKLRLRWWLEHEGKRITRRSKIRPRPGVNQWSVPIRKLDDGGYTLKLQVRQRRNVIAAAARLFRKLAPAEHEVRINRWGRFLVCDGEPFLWYGFYDALYRKDESPDQWIDTVKELKAADCTAVLMYTHRDILNAERIQWALDEAQKQGIKVWLHASAMFAYRDPKYNKGRQVTPEDDRKAFEALREVMHRHKSHPALLGWCHMDEPGNRAEAFTKEYMEQAYAVMKEADPYHPAIFSHLNHREDPERYGGAADMALIPYGARDMYRQQLFQRFLEKGFAMAVNVPFYGAIGGGPVEATPEKVRISVYQPIIIGARAFTSYTYRPASVGTWAEIARVGEELRTLAPVLLTPDERLEVEVTPKGRDVYALLKSHESNYYLLAVNTAPYPVKAAFKLVDVSAMGKLQPMFATKQAQYDVEAREIGLVMDPGSTAVYRIVPSGR